MVQILPAGGVVDSGLKRQRDMIGEIEDWASANGEPGVDAMRGIPVLRPLVEENRHHGPAIVGLDEHLLRDAKGVGIVAESRRRDDGSVEIAGGAIAVLEGDFVVTNGKLRWQIVEPNGVPMGSGVLCA